MTLEKSVATTGKPVRVTESITITTNGADVSVQNPFPTDGDSVYAKDIDLSRSTLNGFSGTITDLFDSANNVIFNASSTNPKSYTVYFKRPLTTSEITLASGLSGNFSNAKLYLYDISGNELLSIDNSTDNTKYTKYVFNNVPQTFIGYKIEFHTADSICLAFNYIHKSTDVQANIKVLDSDTGLLIDVGGHKGHMKSIGYHESIGHGTTNDTVIVERATGNKTNIGTGAFTLLEGEAFVQPGGDTQMYVSSTSTNDIMGGSGLQGLTMEYFPNAWGERLYVNFATTGSSLTALPVSNVYRIHKLYGYLGLPAEGDITITGAGGTILYGQVSEYETFMDRCIFYVAENETVTCTEGFVSCTTVGGVLFRFFVTEEDSNGNTITRGRLPIEMPNAVSPLPFEISETINNPNNKRKALGFAVKSAGVAANQSATGYLKGFREPT